MVIRIPLAFALGLVIYMIGMAMTVYDSALSLIFQPIVGSILTALALLGICILGSPLLIRVIWNKWRRVSWLALLLTVAGIATIIASWYPSLRVKVIDPETKMMVESFHPILSTAGWLAAMFGVVFCPWIGFRGDKRWV